MIISSPYGGFECNAYGTFAEVNSYILTACLYPDQWTAATAPQADALIVRATMNIDALNWEGERFFYNQLLEFPRRRAEDEGLGAGLSRGIAADSTFRDLTESDEYLRQQRINVQKALAEQANYLANSHGQHAHREEQFHGVVATTRSVRVGASFSFGAPDMILCPEAWDYLRHYVGSIRIVRG